MKRVLTRLTILAIVVVFGAIAIAQAQRDQQQADESAAVESKLPPESQPPGKLPNGYVNAIRDIADQSEDVGFSADVQNPRVDLQVQLAQAEESESVSQFSTRPDSFQSSAPVRPNPFRTPTNSGIEPAPPEQLNDRFVQPPPLVTDEYAPTSVATDEEIEEPVPIENPSDFAPPESLDDDAEPDFANQFDSSELATSYT